MVLRFGVLAACGMLGSAAIAPAQQSAALPAPKVVRYARSLFQRLDLNRDGAVSGTELASVEPNVAAIDVNHDGRITEAELAAYVAAYGQGRRLRSIGTGSSAAPATTSTIPPAPPATGPARDRQFYVDPKRLPAGLPPWFFERDADGDGQLTPSEFERGGQTATGAEFKTLDRNQDGLVTAEEVAAPASKIAKPTGK